MKTTANTQPYLLDAVQHEKVIAFALETCELQLEDYKFRLDTLLTYRMECWSGIRESKLCEAGQATDTDLQKRECQLLLLHLDKEIEEQKIKLAVCQQKIELYQDRLEIIQGNNQLNELKAAIQAVEHQQQLTTSQSTSRIPGTGRSAQRD